METQQINDFILELKIGGTVYGDPYYEVRTITTDTLYGYNPNWNKMIEWCLETFGPSKIKENGVTEPCQRWYVDNTRFWIRDEKDTAMFLLRWS